MSIREMSKASLLAAMTAVFSVMTINIGSVPITLGIFAILFAAVAAGKRTATAASAVYILIGAVGIPVFGGFKGGAGVLLGPTGGYIISYIPMAFVVGAVSDKTQNIILRVIACVASLLLCYAAGTLWYCVAFKQNAASALAVCVYPFVAFDIIKCIAAALLGSKIRQRIN